MGPSDSGLESQIAFALYTTSRAMAARYRPLLEPLGITFPQYLVLLTLWDDGRPRTVRELGVALRLDSGTLSPLLTRLVQLGLVQRRPVPGDDRAVHIALTDAGHTLRDRAAGVQHSVLDGLDRCFAERLCDDLLGFETIVRRNGR